MSPGSGRLGSGLCGPDSLFWKLGVLSPALDAVTVVRHNSSSGRRPVPVPVPVPVPAMEFSMLV